MSKDIEPTLWAIQEKALKSSTSSQSPEEQKAIKEYEELYQMLEQGKVDDPPMALAQTISNKLVKRTRRQRAAKLFTASLFLLLVSGLLMGLLWLLPQSPVFSQISDSLQIPLILITVTVFGLVVYALKKVTN
ncbi:MAG: hypothetical protein HUJ16_07320 [Kangiella sp.]|nr:hypothetical protein [Kangiella sp.]